MNHVLRVLAFAFVTLALSPALAQPRPNPCATVRCAAPTCPSGQIKTGERQNGCCKVAICKIDCRLVRCAAPTCPSGQIKVGDRPSPDGCCRIAICKAAPARSCNYGGRVYPSGATFPAIDGCNQCNCQHGVVGCTKKACQNKCLNFYHQLCKTNADCRSGYRCSPPVSGCQASSCSCNPTSGAQICTKDCRQGYGKCIR